MKQTDPQYKLRIPADLKKKISEVADANGRSMNAEIVARLECSLASSAFDDAELPAAEDLARASEFSLMEVREAVWSEVVKAIVYQSRFGRRECVVNLDQIEGLDPDSYSHAEILKFIADRLERKGYLVDQPSLIEMEVKW